ncbi:type VI secretion system ImpA family N-terminal domain-containing protein [Vibrio sp. S4M6]|uniref:type VI secretion system protein TssA n=1 Tax=Vibrio sinus TaxID=2946865 RepID=UPI002029E238|nr:type VI secretion system ImpA family N-terminal domain-containing protein [Vibrio sinus]MCL9783148.1 type VI secretion system ImpA family N-terminal domain-containing protein [Vibrio sinus]
MIDTESFLAPISDDEPCGSYLKLDRSAYRSIRNAFNAAQSSFRQLVETPDASNDETLLENNANSWGQLRDITEEALLKKTKDLEILGWFITSQLFTNAPFENLAQSIGLIRGMVEKYWHDLNPKPPEDKLKSTDDGGRTKEWAEFRIKPLLQLVGETPESTSIYVPLQMLPIIGDITYSDYLRAEKNGTLNALKDQARSSYSNESREILLQLSEAYVNLQQSEKSIAEKCNEDGATALSFRFIKGNIEELIKAIQYLVGEKIRPWPLDNEYRVLTEQPSADNTDAVDTSSQPDQTQNTQSNEQATVTVAAIAPGEILNRDHAFKELRKISEYFKETEPHSPISFLLERAIRWGYLSLPELFSEMMGSENSSLNHINQLTGMDNLETVDLSSISIHDTPIRKRRSAEQPDSLTTASSNEQTKSTDFGTTETTSEESEPSPSDDSSGFEW